MEATQSKILIVDDDGHIREVIDFALRQAGYLVEQAQDGRRAWERFESQPETFDLVVLDILMPGLDGLDVCRRIRQISRVPVIFLSSRDEELDRILGLELGADDYVTKPFSPRELVARVKAALRRSQEFQELLSNQRETQTATPSEVLVHGRLSLDVHRHELNVGGQGVVLTVSEFALLEALLRAPGHVLSRAQLVERAYGEAHYLSDRTVDSHVRRIRKKLRDAGAECIETVYGVGYRMMEMCP